MSYSTVRDLAARFIAGALLAGNGQLALADDTSDKAAQQETMRAMQQRIDDLQREVDALKNKSQSAGTPATAEPGATPSNNPPTGRVVLAKEAAATPKVDKPPSLTWHGITLYGTVDIGIAYLTHGAPLSQTYSGSLPFFIQRYSNHPIASIASNGLSQSKLGLSGVEPIIDGLSGVFKLETGFNPHSGRLSDGPGSLVANNGVPLDRQVTASDSSRAGQAFQGAAYAGLSSKTFGTLTFGRQNSPMADNLTKYDPQAQSSAFSPIGFSGVSGGLGDTEDKALDNVVKYVAAYGPGRIALMYQFGSSGAIPEGGEEFDIGADIGGFSVDALYGRIHGAVSVASLTAAQNAIAPGTLAATVSDNSAYSLQASYTMQPVKFYAGYERITYENPAHPIPNGSTDIGGYVLSTVNNTAYTNHRILEIGWTGARYTITPRFDLAIAYYWYDQNSYAANHCSNTSASSCSGRLNYASLVSDYRLTRRFDVYAGINYSSVTDGLASGFLNNTDWAPMIGVRFNF
jgi:predicted porin